eukprot:scaffold3759_cov124-Skeletonema_dohrnii-CCMP3373.AAC.6
MTLLKRLRCMLPMGIIKADKLVNVAEERLNNLAIEKLGKEWYEKGLLNVSSFYDKSSDHIALGHILWIHNA